jgi:hypothetical protein
VMLVTSMVHVPIQGDVGDRYLEFTTDLPALEPESGYEMLLGTLALDFSHYDFGPEPTEMDIRFVVGDLDIFVPPGVDVTIDGSLDVGVADVFGKDFEGRHLVLDGSYETEGLTDGELILHVNGGLGTVTTDWAYWIEDEKRMELDETRKDG